MVFQILAEIEMTRNENRLFSRHFEMVQIFFIFFSWNMVVISVYTYSVKIIKKFRWESGFLGGFHGTPQRKPLYHRIFLIIFTPYVYTLITTIFQEKKI